MKYATALTKAASFTRTIDALDAIHDEMMDALQRQVISFEEADTISAAIDEHSEELRGYYKSQVDTLVFNVREGYEKYEFAKGYLEGWVDAHLIEKWTYQKALRDMKGED